MQPLQAALSAWLALRAVFLGRSKATGTEEKPNAPLSLARGYNTQYLKARSAILADNPLCSICNSQPATTADHIVPLSRGGTNDVENLRPACGPCNFSRGSRTA
ncbi:HNH endonuclease [Streptomyces griseoviridis]